MAEESNSRANRFPTELSFLSGLAFGACNMHFMMLGTVIFWFILRKHRPGIAKPVVLALSGIFSQLALGVICLACGILEADFLMIAEMLGMLVICGLLLYTGWPVWTWLLSLHGVALIAYQLSQSPELQSNTAQSRSIIGAMLIQALTIWLLFPFLFRSAILTNSADPAVDQPPSDPSPPADQGETAGVTD